MTDQIAPNYLTIGTDGEVGADFTGLINALGLIIPAADSTPPALDQSVRWVDANGDMVSQIYTFTGAGSQSEVEIEAHASDTLLNSSVAITSLTPQCR